MPIQLGLLYLGERGIGLMFYWITILIWHIWAISLEFMDIQNYIKENTLKNLYFTIIESTAKRNNS